MAGDPLAERTLELVWRERVAADERLLICTNAEQEAVLVVGQKTYLIPGSHLRPLR